jgi:DNA-binding Lrp family transcriptional regulator
MVKIDKNDHLLIDLLRQDSKRTVQQLAQRLALPPTTVHNRIRRLEQLGVIKGYTILVDETALGKGLAAVVLVTVSSRTPSGIRVSQDDVAREIRSAGAEGVSVVTGGADIVATVHAKDLAGLNDLVVRKFRTIDGVDKTQTMVVLNTF